MPGPPVGRGIGYLGPRCPHCKWSLDLDRIVTGRVICDRCRGVYEAQRFDPPETEARVLSLAEAGPAGGNACANHAGNCAIANCDRCGVFMCSLCRIAAEQRVLCPACFERLWEGQELQSAWIQYADYSRLAMVTSLIALLTFYFGVVLGPLGIWASIHALRQSGPYRPSRVAAVAAMLVGCLAAVLNGVFWFFVVKAMYD
ncbi:MAG: hypothetical protein MUF51_05285 [Vicinamibacteria bacterium]|jgi:hypothetical protein|nr:hypothetical protein [Vicinamibacteria bacterium]